MEDQEKIPHYTVMKSEILSFCPELKKSKMCICDATLGHGGHAEAVLEKLKPATFIGIDQDKEAIELSKTRLNKFQADHQLYFFHSNYSEIENLFRRYKLPEADYIYYDLGVSTLQLKSPQRGFSFRDNGPLDMRMNPESNTTAQDLITNSSEEELSNIFYNWGEETFAKKIAKHIVKHRKAHKIESTTDLAKLITDIKGKYKSKIHPATKCFQALRIAVNDELKHIELTIDMAIKLLKPQGRLAIISFHSLEDRIVKQSFKKHASSCICPREAPICKCSHTKSIKILTPKPIYPSEEEQKSNRRSRSARLRIAERL